VLFLNHLTSIVQSALYHYYYTTTRLSINTYQADDDNQTGYLIPKRLNTLSGENRGQDGEILLRISHPSFRLSLAYLVLSAFRLGSIYTYCDM